MANAAEVTRDGHLAGRIARLGAPDARLIWGGVAFPVHRGTIGARSGLLRGLFEASEGDKPDLCLDAACGAGKPPLELCKDTVLFDLFELFLALLYASGGGGGDSGGCGGCGGGVAAISPARVRGLVALSEFFDAPCVLPAADSALALALAGCSGFKAENYTQLGCKSDEDLVACFHMLSKHKMRR